jgi:membrane protein DedA with SNARE-associated domain
MFSAIHTLIQSAGYPLVFVLILAESGGIPVPGETTLIAAGALAAAGQLSIAGVIGVNSPAVLVGLLVLGGVSLAVIAALGRRRPSRGLSPSADVAPEM